MSTPRTALVTGAAGGMGYAIVQRLADDGFAVCATDIAAQQNTLAALKRNVSESGGQCTTETVDVRSREQVEAVRQHIRNCFGSLDVLVNAAGVLSIQRIDNITEAEWDRIFDVNVKGTFNTIQVCLADLRASSDGRVINLASIGGKLGVEGQSHYAASKAAVIRLTQVLAKELASDGINVNAICPGVIDTDMGRQNYPDANSLADIQAKTAMGRLGVPADVVGTVSFLSAGDSAFITGQSLNVCGGIVFD